MGFILNFPVCYIFYTLTVIKAILFLNKLQTSVPVVVFVLKRQQKAFPKWCLGWKQENHCRSLTIIHKFLNYISTPCRFAIGKIKMLLPCDAVQQQLLGETPLRTQSCLKALVLSQSNLESINGRSGSLWGNVSGRLSVSQGDDSKGRSTAFTGKLVFHQVPLFKM